MEFLEKIIKIYEKEKQIKKENQNYKDIINLKQKIQIQKIRKSDGNVIEKVAIFSVKDKQNKEYKFLVRENANNFIENNKEKFSDNVTIEIKSNEYLDLQQVLK